MANRIIWFFGVCESDRCVCEMQQPSHAPTFDSISRKVWPIKMANASDAKHNLVLVCSEPSNYTSQKCGNNWRYNYHICGILFAYMLLSAHITLAARTRSIWSVPIFSNSSLMAISPFYILLYSTNEAYHTHKHTGAEWMANLGSFPFDERTEAKRRAQASAISLCTANVTHSTDLIHAFSFEAV